MKKLLLLSLLAFPFFSVAQKIKIDDKTNIVSVDGSNSFKIERSGCGFGMVDCHFDVFDLEDKKVIRINYREFNSPVEINAANPKGTVRYYEFIFLDSKQKAEVAFMGIKDDKVAKTIAKNNLLSGGKLNDKSVEEFIFVNGTKFSERVKF